MEVFIIAAISQDGFISRSQNDRSFNWTSYEDQRFYVKKIKSSDAIVMGRKTFQTFRRHPRNTDWYIYTKNPTEFINPNPKVITATGTNQDPKTLIADLKQKGKQTIAICGGKSIYQMFFDAGLVNTVYQTIEPVTFGKGVPFLSEESYQKLTLKETTPLSDTTKVKVYSVKN